MTDNVLPSENVISGPFHLYDGSFIVEFLQPDPSRNATSVLSCIESSTNVAQRVNANNIQTPTSLDQRG